MASLSSFLPYVLPHIKGCPDVVAREEILRAAIRFCKETLIWKEWQAGIDIVFDTASYTITCPTDGAVARIDQVFLDGTELTPTNVDLVAEEFDDWNTAEADTLDSVTSYIQLTPDTIRLVPIPQEALADGLVILASYKPTRTATTIPDFIYQDYVDVIADGAIAQACATPGTAWFNAQVATFRATEYAKGMREARAHAYKSFTRSKSVIKPRVVYS